MDLQFEKTICTCLDAVVCEVHSAEQTQELRISDGMPDIGRILSAWGQPILRSKEWLGDSIQINGGMLVWVLYAPEDGTEPRSVDAWLPFQMKWDLPEDAPEGQIRIQLLPRFVDARSVSARKMMLRAGVGALAQAYVPVETESWNAEIVPEDVELLRSRYPVRVYKEAGEKSFLLDEDLTMPASIPLPERLVYYSVSPEVTDRKVMGDKVVFRGNGNLHLLYRSEEGQLHSWDFPVPFSQYVDLQDSFSTEARADVALCPTSLEVELDDEGHLRLKCGLTGQYLVDNQELLEVVEDAYSPARDLQMERRNMELPAVLDTRQENIFGEQTIPADVNLAADLNFLPDFPRQYRSNDNVRMELPGMFQALYYDENGALQGTTARWEGNIQLNADEDSRISAVPMRPSEPQISLSDGTMTLKSELPMAMTSTARQQIPMVTGLTLGEVREPDPGRPSLILHRAGNRRLWDIAKESGSTVEAIRKANGLQEEPDPGRMLLIPVS